MKKHGLLIAAFLLPAALSFGAGYQLNLQGLRQLAMGGGGVAWPWDASTIFYNPGGLSHIDGIQAYGSVLAIVPRIRYVQTGANSYSDAQHQVFTPFNLYVGGTPKKGGRLGVGVGVYTPFGSGVKWEDDWAGRYVTQEIALKTIFVQPTLSYRIDDMISIGAGFIYAFGDVTLKRAIPVQNSQGQDGQAVLEGKADGIGYNLGINIKANDRLHFGLSYRSRVDMKVDDGDATFTVPTSLATSFPSSSFSSKLPLPEVLSVGVGYKPLEKFTMQLDFNLVGWTPYDTLRFDYEQNTPQLADTRAARLYKNTLAVRLGGSYQATEKLQYMLGVAYDPSPVRDNYVSPDLPDANRIVLTGGFTYKPSPKLTILAAVEYVTSEKRDANYQEAGFGGQYQTKALSPGLGISYDF